MDIESEAYAVAHTAMAAAHQLNAQCPDATIWFVRIGHRALHRIGTLSIGIDVTDGGEVSTQALN